MPPLVSIVVPVFNERSTLAELIDRLLALPLDHELVVVDDGSRDGSTELLQRLAAGEPRVTAVYQPENGGKGSALRAGFARASGEVIAVLDADLELCPEDLLGVARRALAGAPVVHGSRFVGGGVGADGGLPLLSARRLANGLLSLATSALYGTWLTDMETGCKCWRREVLRRITVESSGYEVEPELTAKVLRLGYPIVELPVSYRPSFAGQGSRARRIGLGDGLLALATLLRYRVAPREQIASGAP